MWCIKYRLMLLTQAGDYGQVSLTDAWVTQFKGRISVHSLRNGVLEFLMVKRRD